MTKEQYRESLAGLQSFPQKHIVIHGVQPHSVDELNRLAVAHGYKHEPEKAPVQTSVKPKAEPVAPVVEKAKAESQSGPAKGKDAKGKATVAPSKVEEVVETKSAVEPEISSEVKAASDGVEGEVKGPVKLPDGVEIPENLMTLKYNELRSLASRLGIAPVPNGQADLLAAITAKRDGG